jgi:hypothetical protein
MAAGEGEAAGISGKRTYAGLTAGLGLTAAVPGTRREPETCTEGDVRSLREAALSQSHRSLTS